jgi:hypothetical protein
VTDDGNFAKGLMYGLAISALFWGAFAAAIWWAVG